jgi:tripartite-type tricarboxylate transporter receptor subunit TctC
MIFPENRYPLFGIMLWAQAGRQRRFDRDHDTETTMMNRRDFVIHGLASAPLWTALPGPAWPQGHYPERPIRLIVPRSAGGVVDMVARQWAEAVRSRLGAVVIENQGGGGGTIGTMNAAHAPADGYTLLLGSTSDLVLNPAITPQLQYAATDFASIALVAISVAAIMVNPSVPARTLQEFVAYAKANPGKLSYGSAGVGTMSNLAGELFKQLAGLPDIVHIPYKGAAGSYPDLISGQIPMVAANISEQTIELHRAGKIRILAVTTEKRLASAPELPTAADAGYPDLIAQLFMGLFAPAATPAAVIAQLAAVTGEVMGDKELQGKLVSQGFEPVLDSGPEKTAQYLKAEVARWTPILKASGMKPG